MQMYLKTVQNLLLGAYWDFDMSTMIHLFYLKSGYFLSGFYCN